LKENGGEKTQQGHGLGRECGCGRRIIEG